MTSYVYNVSTFIYKNKNINATTKEHKTHRKALISKCNSIIF